MLNATAKIAHLARERERERVIAQFCESCALLYCEFLHFVSFLSLNFLDSRESCAESIKCEL